MLIGACDPMLGLIRGVQACLLGVAAASDLTASYWGSFALGRLLAIPLSTWVSPGVMLGCSLGVRNDVSAPSKPRAFCSVIIIIIRFIYWGPHCCNLI